MKKTSRGASGNCQPVKNLECTCKEVSFMRRCRELKMIDKKCTCLIFTMPVLSKNQKQSLIDTDINVYSTLISCTYISLMDLM